MSVYEIESGQIEQARAEHLVSMLDSPASENHIDLDLKDLGALVKSPGSTRFQFTVQAHAELILADRESLLRLIEVVRASPHRRLHRQKGALQRYIVTRLADDDPEWVSALTASPKWADFIRKKREAGSS
ncbi:MAG: hypothetical protein MUC96_15110 [Myxococcaceae bacterium]|nr:hypothetical protein [Myxococcaceae bacterium]